MRVHIGSDHAGFELKHYLVMARRPKTGTTSSTTGRPSTTPRTTTRPYCIRRRRGRVADPGSLCVVIGGSGNGEQIAANKVTGVRAALAYNLDTAKLGRQHNDANVIGIGARMHSAEEALELVGRSWPTPFSGDERHPRRIRLLADYEASH